MSDKLVLKIAQNGIVGAIYFLLCFLFQSISFGTIQVRFAEILNLLCFFRPDYIFGVTLGCFLANLQSSLGWPDILIGTAATFLSCLLIAFSSPRLFFACFYPVIINGLVVGAELCWLLDLGWNQYFYQSAMVALGETISMVIGYLFFVILRRNKNFMDVIGATKHRDFIW